MRVIIVTIMITIRIYSPRPVSGISVEAPAAAGRMTRQFYRHRRFIIIYYAHPFSSARLFRGILINRFERWVSRQVIKYSTCTRSLADG